MITNEIARSGQNVRKYYQRRLPSDSSKDYYYLLRDTPNNETLIVEYGFADSTGDDVSILKNNWEDLAEAVVRALTTYIGVPYTNEGSSSSGNFYTVKPGDTLWKVANANNITVDSLKQANNLTTNSLSVGQLLKIPTTGPGSADGENTYKVKSGDSLYKIANQFNTTVDILKQLNNLTSNNLQINQVLKLPKENDNFDNNTYVVKSGDSLYKIANQFNTTVSTLRQLNNLSSDLLSIGQVLKIPNSNNNSSDGQYYIVVKGDNLYDIANRFGVTVSAIMTANNLSNSNLSIGQRLKIPTSSSNQIYTVVSGDSLYKIANQFNTSVKELQSLNNLNTTNLSVGQKLLIP